MPILSEDGYARNFFAISAYNYPWRSKEDSGSFKHWQALDTEEREVGYISQSVNGKSPGVENQTEQSLGKRLCVFRYRVTTAKSTLILYANGAGVRGLRERPEPASVAQKLSRIAQGSKIDAHYAMSVIGGTEFVLPQTSEEMVRFR